MTSHIVAVGGGQVTAEITRAALALTKKDQPSVFVCGLASALPDTAELSAEELFRKRHGLHNVFAPPAFSGLSAEKHGWGSMPWPRDSPYLIEKQRQVDSPDVLDQLAKADLMFLCGGDQRVLLSVLPGTAFLRQLTWQWLKGETLIMGTSAGLQVLSEWALTGDPCTKMRSPSAVEESVGQGLVDTVRGFGFISGVIFDQHFIRRKRFGRLFSALTDHPSLTGVGVDEDTALVISGLPGNNANKISIIGERQIFIAKPCGPSAGTFNCSFVRADQPFPVPLHLGSGPQPESSTTQERRLSRESEHGDSSLFTLHRGETCS